MAASDPAPPPAPRSPPKYPDFCGRRRLQLEVQMLNREMGFLEEELQSLDGVQPVSRCCKEVNEFVGANPDPLIPINKKRRKPCRIWKWLRSKLCYCFSSICCSTGCSLQLERPSCTCPHPTYRCCGGCQCSCPDCQCGCPSFSCCKVSCFRPRCCCRVPRCRCRCRCCFPEVCCCRPRWCRWEDLFCCGPPRCCCDVSCCRPQCSLPSLSCPELSCGCIWSCPKCTGVQLCPKCTKTCCISGCEC